MADEQADGGAAEGAEAIAAPKGKLKLVIAAVGVITILGGGVATWFLLFKGGQGGEAKQAEVHPAKPPSFMDVPEMLVNLVGAPGERVQYLKVKVVLELKEDKQIDAIKPTLPRITDIFQTYLRELRPIDLNGSAGMFRLKEELTKRGLTAREDTGGRGDIHTAVYKSYHTTTPNGFDLQISATTRANRGA